MKLTPVSHNPFAKVTHKVTKASVDYSKGMPSSHCGICQFYRDWSCTKVRGEIAPDMWCQLYKRKHMASGGRIAGFADGGDPILQHTQPYPEKPEGYEYYGPAADVSGVGPVPSSTEQPFGVIQTVTEPIEQGANWLGGAFGQFSRAIRMDPQSRQAMSEAVLGKQLTDVLQSPEATAALGVVSGMPTPNPLGFYSAAAHAVDTASTIKATPQQWLGTIRNTPGVKAEELQWTGLEDWLKSQQGPVTKQQVQDYIRGNQLEVKDVTKGGGEKHRFGTPEEQAAALQRYEDSRQALLSAKVGTPEFQQAANEYQAAQDALKDIVPGWGRAEGGGEFIKGGDTKFGSYIKNKGDNYKETLLMLPDKGIESNWQVVPHPSGNGFAIKNDVGAYGLYPSGTGGPAKWSTMQEANNAIPDYAHTQLARPEFKDPHWDEPNVVANVLHSERDIGGKRYLQIHEVQSGWGQALHPQEVAKNKAIDSNFLGVTMEMEKAGDLKIRCD